MALTLDPTVGGLSANTYASLADAQSIIDATPNASAWGIDANAQTQALIMATTMLGAMDYKGYKTTVAQALAWPRASVMDPDYGDTSGAFAGYMVGGGAWGVYLDLHAIPRRIVRACVMLALEVLRAGTSDVWGVDPTLDVQREQVDVLATDYVPPWFRRVGLRRYPSVWRELYPLTTASAPAVVERA